MRQLRKNFRIVVARSDNSWIETQVENDGLLEGAKKIEIKQLFPKKLSEIWSNAIELAKQEVGL